MTCDIYGTEINKLNENTEKVNEVSHTLIPLKALMNDSLENCDIERCKSRRDKYKITKQSRHRRINKLRATDSSISFDEWSRQYLHNLPFLGSDTILSISRTISSDFDKCYRPTLRAQNSKAHGDWMEGSQRKIQHKDCTMNSWTDVEHCNGATGVVLDFIYVGNQQPPDLPLLSLYKFMTIQAYLLTIQVPQLWTVPLQTSNALP